MPKPTDYDKTHRRNMAAIGTRIDRLFKKATEEAAKIGVSIKATLPNDRIFSFADYPETKKQIDRLLAALQESMETAIVSGVRSAWMLSNNKNNALVHRIFGDNVTSLSKEQYRRYFSTNMDALEAFIQRKEAGLNLSDRVWKYTDAFKREIELGLDLGIRTGQSAADMTRSLRQYLQHPDKLFRRVRDKHGNLRLSRAAAAFHPGRGVYRSSYKNARRLAATETNIAYRTSDHLRWQQMDFVVGIEVKLSNNHTLNGVAFTDICDQLKGKYPKDFKFTGWHPRCRCHAITVLKTEEEMEQDTARILDGKNPTKTSVNTVQNVPPAFKSWVEDHADRIEAGGRRVPYFIRDNEKRVNGILGLETEPPIKTKTPKEIADERHAARTQADIDKIQSRWNEKRIRDLYDEIHNGNLPPECADALQAIAKSNTNGDFEEVKNRLAHYRAVASRHASRKPEDIQRIKDAWAQKLARDAKTRRDANRVLTLAKGWNEVDYTALEKLIASNNLTAMPDETRKLMDALKDMRKQEKALEDIIPNAHEWHKKFTLAELQATRDSVQRTLKRWSWDINDVTELERLRKGLDHEVTWMGTKGRKYATWEVAQAAYAEKLSWAEKRIEFLKEKTAIEADIKILSSSRSKVSKQRVAEFEALFKDDNTDLALLKVKAAAISAKAKQLQATRSRKKTTSTNTGVSFTGMTDAEAKKAFQDFAAKHGVTIDPGDIVVDKGFIHLQGDQQERLYDALRPETDAQRRQLWNHTGGGGAHGGRGGYVQTGNSWEINSKFRKHGITGNIDATAEAALRSAGLTADDITTIKLLDKKIGEFSLPIPLLATRYVDVSALSSIFGQTVTGGATSSTAGLKSWVSAIRGLPSKDMVADPAFMSASTNEWKNVFYRGYKVKLQIEIPPGTPMYLSKNYQESEIVLGRATQLEFIGVDIGDMTKWGTTLQHVVIRCRVKL